MLPPSHMDAHVEFSLPTPLTPSSPLPQLHFVVLGLAVVLLPLCAAWLRARAPGRRAAQQAALVAHMVCWAALWAVSQRASAGLPPRASSALCLAAAPEAAALLVILLRLASHSWVRHEALSIPCRSDLA